MKKKILIIVLIIIVLIPLFYFGYKKYQEYEEQERIRNAKIVVNLKENLKITYDTKLKNLLMEISFMIHI